MSNSNGLPTISVFISNFNHGHLLPRALDSICIQETPPDEIVVADDFSTDNSLEVLAEYAKRYPFLRYYRYPEKSKDHIKVGLQQFDQLKGDYVHWFASDDKIYPGFFQKIKETAQRYPGVGVICSSFHHWGPNETPFRTNTHGFNEVRHLEGPELIRHLCQPHIGVSGVASVTRLDAYQWLRQHGYEEIGQWMEFGLSVATIKYGLAVIPDILGAYTDFGPSYHMENMYHETRCLEWFQRLRMFLRQPAFQGLVPPEAIEAFEKTAYSTFPPQTKLRLELNHWMQQAQQHLASGQFDQAAQIAQALVNQQPNFAPGWELAGVVCFQLNRPADAEQAFRRGLQLLPQNANLYNNLGVALRMQGRLDEALPALQQALQLNPNFGEAYQNLGDILASTNRLPEARAMFERALQVNPNLTQARNNLDQLLAQMQLAPTQQS